MCSSRILHAERKRADGAGVLRGAGGRIQVWLKSDATDRRHPAGIPATLSTSFHKYDHVCCVDFRFWRGATREHPPQWGCDREATKPGPKSDATLWAAVLFGPDVVAHSLQTPEGYALVPVRKHLAPRLGQKSLAANVVGFMECGT